MSAFQSLCPKISAQCGNAHLQCWKSDKAVSSQESPAPCRVIDNNELDNHHNEYKWTRQKGSSNSCRIIFLCMQMFSDSEKFRQKYLYLLYFLLLSTCGLCRHQEQKWGNDARREWGAGAPLWGGWGYSVHIWWWSCCLRLHLYHIWFHLNSDWLASDLYWNPSESEKINFCFLLQSSYCLLLKSNLLMDKPIIVKLSICTEMQNCYQNFF